MYDHRADNCPTKSTIFRCPDCTRQLKQAGEEHQCFLLCLHCGSDHRTNDPSCQIKRQKDQNKTERAYLQRIKLRNEQQPTLGSSAPNTATSTDYHREYPALLSHGQQQQTTQTQQPQKKQQDMLPNTPLSQPTTSASATPNVQQPASSKSPARTPQSGRTIIPKAPGKPSTPIIPQSPSFKTLTSQAHSPTPIYEAPQYQQHVLHAHSHKAHSTLESRLNKSETLLERFESIEKKLDRLTDIVEKLASAYERHETRLTLLEQRVDRMLKRLLPDEDLSYENMDHMSHSQKRQLPDDPIDTSSTQSKTAKVANPWQK
ncbi:probable plasma membrane ATPase [Dermacentor albipictus]|uniref:probable plasma membrane ATPase n=1 Tax=Dermacentor albipictus TaxID=60249 RepID=UPI0038FC6A52